MNEQEYNRIQDLIFSTFTTVSGKQVLELLISKTVGRKNNLPVPRTIDQQVNYLTEQAYRAGRESIVLEILNQIEQCKLRRKNNVGATGE